MVYQPDPDFQSFDGLAMQSESWLEIPLKSDRPLPMTCAVSPVTCIYPLHKEPERRLR